MQQPLGQTQLGQSPQMVQQSSLVQAQQQMAQSQLAQQQINQPQITQQQLAQSQLAQQQMAQQQQQMAQTQMTQQHLAQQQIAQSQLVQQQMAQSQLVQQQMAQSQMAQQQINQPQIVQQQITQPQMIQQQIAQQVQQHIGQQQLQQMMYCPTVRLVYDTPMQLMQSGDQIQQQNQNIFVNQPPWARPVQNQVIYVQQIGSNLVPVQHIDPNMFLQQNIPMYQQVVQNVPQLVQNMPQTVQSLPQGQIRQIINNIPSGVVPNFGPNIQRIQEQNIGQMVQNFGLVQTNNDVPMNATSNEVDSQAMSNQASTQQNTPNQETVHIYRQIIPQMNQQQQARTQVPSSQQQSIQNMQTAGQQIVTNVGQAVGTNIRPVGNISVNTQTSAGMKINNVRPTATHTAPNSVQSMNHMIRTNSNPIVNTTANANSTLNLPPVRHINVNIAPQNLSHNLPNTSVPMQTYTTNVGNLNTVTYSAVRNGQPYTYRAIQPKPNNNTNIRVNFKPRGSPMQMVRRPVAPNAPNISQNISVSTNATPTSVNYIKMETDSPMFNRKRKSESPDEIQKKISNYGSITVTAQVKDKIKAKYANTSEIGVNTSPVHKMHKVNQSKVENQLPLLQINPMEAKIKQEFLSPTNAPTNNATILNNTINNANVVIKTEAGTAAKERKVSKDVGQQTEEKLVRKTVFPQAKATGRLLDAKTSLDMPKIDEISNSINIINNESIQGPLVIDEAKMDANINMTNNENQKTQQINFKQSNTIKEKNKLEQCNVVKGTLPNLSDASDTTSISSSILSTQKNISTPIRTQKYEDIKIETIPEIPLEAKKDVDCKLPLNEEKPQPNPTQNKESKTEIFENSSTQNKEKSSELYGKTSIEVVDSTQIATTNKTSEKSVEIQKSESLLTDTKIATESDFEKEIKDNKIEKKEYKNISINEMKNKEIHIVDGNIHEEKRDFVLTHVLDGFVIQESNVPFAIRRPLKEKTVNAFVEDKTDPCIKAAKDEIRGQILELSQLHINENKEREKIDKETGEKELDTEDAKDQQEVMAVTETKEEESIIVTDMKDNPFESLKQNIVKSWTVEDLATHLAKHNWTETVSTLQEHEIDGESLFLVTKTQLVTIGVNENHAEVICEFVGSKG